LSLDSSSQLMSHFHMWLFIPPLCYIISVVILILLSLLWLSPLRTPETKKLIKQFQVHLHFISLHPEDGGSIDLRNVGILPQHYATS
jgi:hypothetical protein